MVISNYFIINRICSAVFFKGFWLIEKLLFLVPVSLVKVWLGLWILLPNFHVIIIN